MEVGKRALYMQIWEDGLSPLLRSVQSWAGPLDLTGTAGAAQWVGVHAMAADLGALSRAGNIGKGGPFRLVLLRWHLGLAGVSGRGHCGCVSGCGTLAFPILLSGLI